MLKNTTDIISRRKEAGLLWLPIMAMTALVLLLSGEPRRVCCTQKQRQKLPVSVPRKTLLLIRLVFFILPQSAFGRLWVEIGLLLTRLIKKVEQACAELGGNKQLSINQAERDGKAGTENTNPFLMNQK